MHHQKKNIRLRVKARPKSVRIFFQKNIFRIFSSIFCVAVAIGVFFAFKLFHFQKSGEVFSSVTSSTTALVQEKKEVPCNFRRVLDGVCVETQEAVNPPLVGVMVENSLDAQPLSGVAKASIVYEAPAEANIPRFLAIFPLDATVEQVGPVRSARPYYVDWVSGYADAMYMHVGGSPEALKKIKNVQFFDMNEMYNGDSFWRATSRLAPHNVYTSSDLWNTAHEKNIDEFKNDVYVGSKFESKEPCKGECVKQIHVQFSPAYMVLWQYNEESGVFERSLNGQVQKDADGSEYLAHNVILLTTKIDVIDEVGRKKIKTLGEGDVKIFSGGVFTPGKWKKETRTSGISFFDAEGSEIKLAPGKTWVEVISP